MSVTIIGIDPGIVHTGIVVLTIDPQVLRWSVDEHVVPGVMLPDPEKPGQTKAAVDVATIVATVGEYPGAHVFIEAFRPRSHFQHDAAMSAAVRELGARIKRSKVINNTGVKQVVGQQLMQLFAVWKFMTSTNHQDLRSAARIALYGALKDDDLNKVLTQFVVDNLDGRVWTRTAEALI